MTKFEIKVRESWKEFAKSLYHAKDEVELGAPRSSFRKRLTYRGRRTRQINGRPRPIGVFRI